MIENLQSLQNINNITGQTTQKVNTPNTMQASFKDSLFNAIDQVNQAQKASDVKTEQLTTGKVDSLHEVMIASEQAGLSLQLTMEIRNKVVSAYQEVMRMQI
ncbi:flagellar hook-basal body complex protein FliE [Aureibacillus halotolerans]|uniref:Flagellar hook-basal body complex protein FliE n=1 Tax=Aureibacillus halotolerans TaxID=1508390 RepID=A0A4R6U9A2_9BACI|nr:flagellar hook-basal body complex protein FliE [Aureibacillus halotolerans]TDQ39644.1 flagellar hook-basal body complex protein FliE [Aureibacillus halotolerans]